MIKYSTNYEQRRKHFWCLLTERPMLVIGLSDGIYSIIAVKTP